MRGEDEFDELSDPDLLDELEGVDEYDSWRVFLPEDDDVNGEDDLTQAADEKPTLDDVIAHLLRGERRYADLLGLSDLGTDDLATLVESWDRIAPDLRATVVSEAFDLAQDNIFLEFSRFFLFASHDGDDAVRQHAVRALGQQTGDGIAPRLIALLEGDPSEDVRIAAATSLGPWAEYAALDELDADLSERIASLLFAVAESGEESWHVRRRAAESAAIFGPNARVHRLIQVMYDEDELGLRASAIFAAGRANQREWLPVVLEELANDDPELRFEAARAAGWFADVSALPALSELAKDDEDSDVRHAAILAIGNIGGRGGIRILNRLVDVAPDGDQDVIEEALVEASILSVPFGQRSDDD
ncbi:MAG TPA: HEAT repeat domain-containing protein [Thermomicrobiales bacterium]|nr:HEAT repeat domain-containing protein [Thermomicrobiales bacterium]